MFPGRTGLRSGRLPPPSYYERIRQQPDFFEIGHGWIRRAQEAVRTGEGVRGTLNLVVVQALFADSPEPFVTAQQVQQVLFDGPTPHGTLTEFYDGLSGGRLRVTGRVLPWVRTPLTVSEVLNGAVGGLGTGARTGEFLVAALARADSLVDFGLFDNDGPDGIPNSGDDSGRVDTVVFQFIEIDAACGGPAIWPHRGRISGWMGAPFETSARRPDGSPVLVDDYIVQSSVVCSGNEIQSANVIAHELGHVLGLPDLYDAGGGLLAERRRWVVGCWSLMSAGAWGCGSTATPVQHFGPTLMGPWEREILGWGDFVTVEPGIGQEIHLPSVQSSERVLRVPLSGTEYLLIEYRTRDGFDRALPAAGVLVYHVDRTVRSFLTCEACPRVYPVSLVEADGNDALVRPISARGNRGAAAPGRFTAATQPALLLNAGAPTSVAIHDIRLEGDVARLYLLTRTLPYERLMQPFLGGTATPLTDAERTFLDRAGNRNGRYDVGDLRRYLLDHPAVRR